jgi:NAD-dependent deacetylase sirtuin 5
VAQIRCNEPCVVQRIRSESLKGVAILPLQAREVSGICNTSFRRDTLSTDLFLPRAFAANPNAAHIALAKFSIESIRKRTAPDATFTLITQNVDGLSARALEAETQKLPESKSAAPSPSPSPSRAAQPQLLEMHGKLVDVLCTSAKCGHCEPVSRSPICAALGGTEALVEDGIVEPIVDEADLPRCTKCGALARPGVVWFGEVPRYMETIDRLVDQADLCLVVGTSSTVSHQPEVHHGRYSPE